MNFDHGTGKNGESHPLWLMYAQSHPVTIFAETPVGNIDDEENLHLSDMANLESESDVESNSNLSLLPAPLTINGKRARKFDQFGGEFMDPLDLDPTYVPHTRKRKAGTCSFISMLLV